MREIKEFPAWRTSGFLGFALLLFALAWLLFAGLGLLRERELFYL
jgi:hypothetical protein